MDATRRSRPADAGVVTRLCAAVGAALAAESLRGHTVAVALSGGRDSRALLDAAVTAGADANVRIVACHVHHGLSAHADDWAAFCASTCASAGVAFRVERIRLAPAPREGIEAAARDARHRALADMAHQEGARAVLLAHHQDDQAETLLLQLLRGAGPRGLAAMPPALSAHGLRWLRPWLDVPRVQIDGYVAARQLAFVEDDSNVSPRHRRNALRHGVVPQLRELAPGYPATLARAASHQAEAAALLHELAAADAAPFLDGATLHRGVLAALSPTRGRNVLRWFLHERGLPPPSSSRLAALVDQLRGARPDAALRLRHAGSEIGLFRERIHAHGAAPPPFEAGWRGDAPLALPHGELRADASAGGDIDLARLFAADVVVRSRAGGERMRLGPGRPSRALKSVLREAALAPWERAALPLVFAGDALAVVPGVAVDPAFRAGPGATAGVLVWTPRGATGPARIARASTFR